jgi:alkylation response protein AidB-like acyl-CoA dehydrogenase
MFKRKKKIETSENLFYFESILDSIDIALGAFYKNNEKFVLSISSDETEEEMQVIHKQMAEETQTENGEFGLAISLEFDEELEADLQAIKNLKQFKHFGNFIKKEEGGLVFYSMILPQEAEKAANICSEVFCITYGHKKNNPSVVCEFYEVEE